MRNAALILIFMLMSACDSADPPQESDFAVLAQAAEGYAQARSGQLLNFPRDHGAHSDFRIEWWYLTANLEDVEGNNYGAQWTLFRSAVRPPGSFEAVNPWQSEQVFMAHFALTTPDGHRAFQRYARGGEHGEEARAGVTVEPFSAWIDNWSLASIGPAWLPLEVRAAQDDYALRLSLDSDRSLVLQGEGGFSQKHPNGGGSHYYSQPFLQASGQITLAGRPIVVHGKAWLDREWSSQFLQPDQAGWDWFALHLDSGEKLMLFRLRGDDENFRHGVLIAANGSKQPLEPSRIEFKVTGNAQVANREIPIRWRIGLPEIDRSLSIEALHPNQWMDVDFPYWEGVVTVDGPDAGDSGVGYLEMTGYRRQQ